jgi:hypothetical protein
VRDFQCNPPARQAAPLRRTEVERKKGRLPGSEVTQFIPEQERSTLRWPSHCASSTTPLQGASRFFGFNLTSLRTDVEAFDSDAVRFEADYHPAGLSGDCQGVDSGTALGGAEFADLLVLELRQRRVERG